jgi:cytidine deaminase
MGSTGKPQVEVSAEQWLSLISQAKVAYNQAYAPYSDFKVGAAALSSDGMIVSGCNVENASYGLTVCAERNCIANGVINHQVKSPLVFSAIVIFTKQNKLIPPCGACRQVIAEFFPASAEIMAANHLNKQQKWTVAQLLPDAFLPEDLLNKN